MLNVMNAESDFDIDNSLLNEDNDTINKSNSKIFQKKIKWRIIPQELLIK